MYINVERIAKELSISNEEVIKLLKSQGIMVSNEKSILTKEDIQLLRNKIIQIENNKKSNENVQEQALKQLEYFLSNYKVFMDTCSLLSLGSDKFWMNVVPIVQRVKNKIIIPTRVFDEVRKHSHNDNKLELQKKAQTLLKTLKVLYDGEIIEFRGEKTDNFADNVFQVVFTKFRMSNNLLLITQDRDLAYDINNLNNIKSAKAKKVYVKRINKYGFLSNFDFNSDKTNSQSTKPNSTKMDSKSQIPEDEKFDLSRQLTNIPCDEIQVSNIPKEGESVYIHLNGKRGRILLNKCIASGGEGNIFETNTKYIAKIYKPGKLDRRKYEKIKLMLTKKISCEGICYPIISLYNGANEFVGYLMPKANGKEIQKSLFIKPLFMKNFPNWKKRDAVQLCVTILKKIKYLHDRNIIMGDINPMNILVVSPEEVYFVDVDSYQIEGFPCPVGTINYTAPEIQGKSYDSFLRTIGNENFAVATLLFMIMLPGKPPYSQQGGESMSENILKMDFSYPLGEQSNKKTPDGAWRFIWSHLTYDIKESFYQTFRKGGENSTEKTRLSVDEWLSKFEHYLYLLDSGKLRVQDEMSEELFPIRYKKNPKVNYVRCAICNMEVPEERTKNGICKECLNKGEVYKCSKCGKEIVYTNYQKYIKKSEKFDLCQECFDYGNEVYSTEICSDCHKRFEITNREYDFYRSKGWNLPKRCKECRKKKDLSDSNSSNTQSFSQRNSSRCFITTAVCKYFDKPDDCYELTLLRRFRDEWLFYTSDGIELIKEYYDIAPNIVSKIEESNMEDIIYHKLWDEYINPCISLIENNEFEKCKKLYISMVNYLKDTFL